MQPIVPTLQQAVEAARSVAAEHGIACERPEVLHASGNAWIHLAPSPVVAQVPKDVVSVRGPSTITHMQRDLAVCAWLDERGCGVGAPSDLLPPGPHEHEGVLVSFYRYYERGERDDVAAGRALREIHEALARYPEPLPELSAPITEPRRLLGLLQAGRLLPSPQIQLLRDRLEDAERHIASWPTQAVQADAHLQNVTWSSTGARWTDWEDVCRAPVLWDMACLVASTQLYGTEAKRLDAALRGYGGPKLDVRELRPFIHARAVGVSAWAATRAAHDERAAKRLRSGLAWLRHHHL
jgi:hypothetical protein